VIKENLEALDSVIKNDIAIFRIVLPTEICLHQQPTAFIHHQELLKLKFAANIYPLTNTTQQLCPQSAVNSLLHYIHSKPDISANQEQTRWCTKHAIGHHTLHCTPSTLVNVTQVPIPRISAVLLQPNITSASLNRCAKTIPVATGDISECTTVQKHKLMSLWFSLLKGSCHDVKNNSERTCKFLMMKHEFFNNKYILRKYGFFLWQT
jgi:hypothetical protein